MCELVVGVETGGLAQRVGLAADVLQVVDVLEQPPVRTYRIAHGRGSAPPDASSASANDASNNDTVLPSTTSQ